MTEIQEQADIELESQQFREQLLKELNGQSEGAAKFIKMVDTRFQSMARRMREHRVEHKKDEERTRKWVIGALAVVVAAIGTADAAVAIIERLV